jgi:hypothetical protein
MKEVTRMDKKMEKFGGKKGYAGKIANSGAAKMEAQFQPEKGSFSKVVKGDDLRNRKGSSK